MNHEQQPPNEDRQEDGPWSPEEQVGDIYASDLPDPEQPGGDERVSASRPQIWIGSWLDYNNGILYGDWIDAAREPEEIHADIQRILAGSPTMAATGEPAEEWGIFDHDDFFAWRPGEQENISLVAAVARGIAAHGPAFAAWADVMEAEELLGGFEDAFLGQYDSVQAYAEQLLDDLGYTQLLERVLPDHVRRYVAFNVAGLARDLSLSGEIHVLDAEGGGVWIFDARN